MSTKKYDATRDSSKNAKNEDVEIIVHVKTRPNLRDGQHEMLLYVGRSLLDNIFDKKEIDMETESVGFYYPETWCNISELMGLVRAVFHYYPNVKKIEIHTHSVYIIQNVRAECIRIYDQPSDYPQTDNPEDHLCPPPEEMEGLMVIGGKMS